MHAFLIALEGYIDTIHYMFTHDPFMGFVLLSIPLGGIAIVLLAPRQQGSQRRVRSHGHGPMSDEPRFSSDTDDAPHGRTSPLFTHHSHTAGEWQGGHSHFMTNGSSLGPSINIDGTPMMSDSNIDIHGNPFGVTTPTFHSLD
jgi:hypothetical protein